MAHNLLISYYGNDMYDHSRLREWHRSLEADDMVEAIKANLIEQARECLKLKKFAWVAIYLLVFEKQNAKVDLIFYDELPLKQRIKINEEASPKQGEVKLKPKKLAGHVVWDEFAAPVLPPQWFAQEAEILPDPQELL